MLRQLDGVEFTLGKPNKKKNARKKRQKRHHVEVSNEYELMNEVED